MKHRITLTSITFLIILLSAFVCILALIPGEGERYTLASVWDEEIEIHGQGVYHRDSHSYAIQAMAQDWVTLLLGIPMLGVSLFLTRKGSLRGNLLLAGSLGYFLYTYASYSFLVMYNPVFLIYVTLFSLSLYGFILVFSDLDKSAIQKRISNSFPRRTLASFFFVIALMLLFLWLGRIVPGLITGKAPVGLETYTTLVIQALDLGVIVPAALIAAITLLRRKAIGFALAAVVVLKGVTMFSAVSTMAVLMYLKGISISGVELVIFPLATVVNFIFGYVILKNVKPVLS